MQYFYYFTTCTVPTFNYCTKCMGMTGIIHDLTPDCHSVSKAWISACMTSQLRVALIRKIRDSSICLAYSFDMLSMGLCTTRHYQTSGRLVQELNVCIVLQANGISESRYKCHMIMKMYLKKRASTSS